MDDYPLLNLFWTMLEFFLLVLWFFLLFKIIVDIFRSHDMGGWGKAGWMLFVILLPLLGVLVYVIVRGRSMGERDAEDAARADAAFKAYVKETAAESGGGGAGQTDQLAKLADLRSSGAISEEEFRKAKEKLLA
ncbi:SHOCT domain-containing protein [Kitasatospora sp. NBC_01560]|uniref:SHOCT domain-containing protein n=1 Tax=Kitasatospora sp. NBC_01560 TaxID=2975965 RepID=UPI00386D1F14